MGYSIPAGFAIASTPKAKTAKAEATAIAKADKVLVPDTERELIAIPRNEQGWSEEFSLDRYGLAMVARRENSVQRIDHHNLGLVPADGDDVAQESAVQAMAMLAVAELRGLDLDDTEDRLKARQIAVATLDDTSWADLMAELADLKADRFKVSKRAKVQRIQYQRSTADVEQHLADKLYGMELDKFRELLAQATPTNGQVLRERRWVHGRLNAKAMKMVRGMNQFGKRIDVDTSELASQLDEAGNLFDVHTVEESRTEARRAKLAVALKRGKKFGANQLQGLMLALDLAGYKLVTKRGEVQFHDDGTAKLTRSKVWSISELIAEHGEEFVKANGANAQLVLA